MMQGLYSGHSYLLFFRSKIIGVSVQMDLMDYRRPCTPPGSFLHPMELCEW